MTSELKYEVMGLMSRSMRSEMSVVLSHVSDDSMVGLDGGSVSGSLSVDGSSVHGTGVTEVLEGNASAVGGNSSGVSGGTVSATSVSVDSDGTSHPEVGVMVGLGGAEAEVVGFTVHVEGVLSSVVADSHPVDAFLDGSPGGGPFGVPVSEASEVGFLMFDGSSESLDSEVVVVHGSSLGLVGLSHHSPGELVVSDGSGVSSGCVHEGLVPSRLDFLGGSSTVLGGEVDVGLLEPSSDELPVSVHVSHAGSLGALEGIHAVEERGVGEVTMGGLSADGCGSVVAADVVPSSGFTPVHEGTVFTV